MKKLMTLVALGGLILAGGGQLLEASGGGHDCPSPDPGCKSGLPCRLVTGHGFVCNEAAEQVMEFQSYHCTTPGPKTHCGPSTTPPTKYRCAETYNCNLDFVHGDPFCNRAAAPNPIPITATAINCF